MQLVDKDPEKAIALFWSAINAGDRVDSALKDMAIVMKQQNRAEEAIEAIKSLRSRCSDQAQESLDNILLDLYKASGRTKEEIELLKHKLRKIYLGEAFHGKAAKRVRSHGRKIHVSVRQETSRVLVSSLFVVAMAGLARSELALLFYIIYCCIIRSDTLAWYDTHDRATSRGRTCSSGTSWRRRWCTGRRR